MTGVHSVSLQLSNASSIQQPDSRSEAALQAESTMPSAPAGASPAAAVVELPAIVASEAGCSKGEDKMSPAVTPASAAEAGGDKSQGVQKQQEGNRAPAKQPLWQRCSKWLDTAYAFIVKHFLVLSLLVAVTFALAYPAAGKRVQSIKVLGNVGVLQSINTILIFLISGLTLNTRDVRKAWQHKWAVAYGFVSILLLSPMLAFAMREIPLDPIEFSMGLAIMCVVPTTLGQGVALVRLCKGNEAVGLILLILTNMLGCLTVPSILKLVFFNFDTQGMSFNLDVGPLFAKLVVTILVPAVVGKALRELFAPVERFANNQRVFLGMFSTFNVAFMAWMSTSGARDALFEQKASMIISVIVLASTIYFFYLAFNYLIVWCGFHTEMEEAISVIIMASQKSAPFAITLISNTTDDPTENGLLVIPAIVVQLVQVFLSAFMAPYVAEQVDKKVAKEKALQQQQQQVLDLEAAAATATTVTGGAEVAAQAVVDAEAATGMAVAADAAVVGGGHQHVLLCVELATTAPGSFGATAPGTFGATAPGTFGATAPRSFGATALSSFGATAPDTFDATAIGTPGATAVQQQGTGHPHAAGGSSPI